MIHWPCQGGIKRSFLWEKDLWGDVLSRPLPAFWGADSADALFVLTATKQDSFNQDAEEMKASVHLAAPEIRDLIKPKM